jgi:hypothetical protein
LRQKISQDEQLLNARIVGRCRVAGEVSKIYMNKTGCSKLMLRWRRLAL